MQTTGLTGDDLFAVRREYAGDTLTVRASGEVDVATAPLLQAALVRAFEDDLVAAIVLDLSKVTFIDLEGLRVLLWAAARSTADGSRLRIRCGSSAVLRLVEETEVSHVLPLAA